MGALDGKVAVITGSGEGLGRAIAIGMAKEGAKVVTNNRAPREGLDAAKVAEEIKQAGGEAVPVFADVSSFTEAERVIKTAVDNFGRLDILVSNAGFDAAHMIWNMTEEDWDSMLDCMLKGAFNCSRFACGVMREQRSGRIILMSSDAYKGTMGHVNYGAAKAGLVGLARSIAREMGRYGVTCNAICPFARTRMAFNPEVLEGLKKRVEKGVMTQEQYDEIMACPGPEFVAPFLAYLASDAGASINGRVFHVTGGTVILHSEPLDEKTIWKDHEKYGMWTQEELAAEIPKIFALTNPYGPEKK
jgi:NAD(P)-dependent dehydrogenase (short-subunit alcohol dehydrogenase family)